MNESEAATFVAEVEAAWNTHDMNRYAELFAEDADFVNVGGWWWRGRSEIQDNHVVLHETRFKDSTMRLELAAFKPVGRDVGVVHVKWRMQGHDASGVQDTTEARHGIWSWVLRDQDGEIEVVSSHNTETLSAPPDHPLADRPIR